MREMHLPLDIHNCYIELIKQEYFIHFHLQILFKLKHLLMIQDAFAYLDI